MLSYLQEQKLFLNIAHQRHISLASPCSHGVILYDLIYIYILYIYIKSFSHVRLFATPWTVESLEFWSRQPFPSPGDLPNPDIECRSPALQADSLPPKPRGKPKYTGLGSLSLLQGIFWTQESKKGLLHLKADFFYQLSYEGSPCTCFRDIDQFNISQTLCDMQL